MRDIITCKIQNIRLGLVWLGAHVDSWAEDLSGEVRCSESTLFIMFP